MWKSLQFDRPGLGALSRQLPGSRPLRPVLGAPSRYLPDPTWLDSGKLSLLVAVSSSHLHLYPLLIRKIIYQSRGSLPIGSKN